MKPRRDGTPDAIRDQAEALAAPLPPLLVAAERLASSVSLGVHGRRKAGMGESFWQFRRHRAEDAATAIDWRQSARSQHLFVREREWEAAEAVWFWRDGSPGMRFQSQWAGTSKIDRATVLMLALAALLIRGGERIALLGDGHGPGSGRPPLRRIAHELVDFPPDDDPLPPDAPVTRNAQFVWFSDFLSPPDQIEAAMKRLARAGLGGHLVHIIDPTEEDFPFTGRIRFEAAGLRESEILGRAEGARSSYQARFEAHREAVRLQARRMGWSYLAHRTDKPPEIALVALYADLSGAPVKMRGA